MVLWMLPTPLITVCRVASSVTSHANRLLFHTRVLIAVVGNGDDDKISGEQDSPKYLKGQFFGAIFFWRRSYIPKCYKVTTRVTIKCDVLHFAVSCYCSPNWFYKDNFFNSIILKKKSATVQFWLLGKSSVLPSYQQ